MSSNAQIPCLPRYGSVYSSATIPKEYPLDLSMPAEVIAGHKALDNILKTATLDDLTALEQVRTPVGNTVRALMKYNLILTDYDPFVLHRIAGMHRSYMIRPLDIKLAILERVRRDSSTSNFIRALIGSEYIAIIKIDSIYKLTDTSAAMARTATIAHFTVVDSLLGKVYPSSLVFDARQESVEWALHGDGDALFSTDQTIREASLIMPLPGQYLIFLRFMMLRSTITTTYFSLAPNV
ncbi:MAG: hypothetical protein SGJ05_02525 [bacterium]|nr:hypothetical protein [bacterium]